MDSFNIYAVLTPIALTLLLLEVLYNFIFKKKLMNFADSITNLGTALLNQCTNLLVAVIVYKSFGWLNGNFAFYAIENTLLNFCLLLILFDFLFYWFHRFGHSINILWAAHMPHHSSEEFNLFVGFRASITQRLFSFSFMWPLALIGFDPKAIYMASAVQLILAYWHHTKVIGKMGWFEVVFNSPSYHRVHHGINEKYLDKNFGEIFILWDKMFGTYQKEEEPVVFGSLNPVESWSPNKINFQFWFYLLQDAIRTQSWWDKIRLWFMPLGWRPEDCKDRPRKRISSETLIKFQSETISILKIYLSLQSIFGLIIMYFIIQGNSPLLISERVLLSILLWIMVSSWGELLEQKKFSLVLETIQVTILCSYFYYLWNQYHNFDITFYLGFFLILSYTFIAKIKNHLLNPGETSQRSL